MEKKEKMKQSEALSTFIYLIASIADHVDELGAIIDAFNLDQDLMYDTKKFKIDEYHNYNYDVNIVDKFLCFKKKVKYIVDVELNFSNLKVKTFKLKPSYGINQNETLHFYCRNLINFLGERYNNNLIFKYESSWNKNIENTIDSNDVITGDCLIYLTDDLKYIRVVETGYKNYMASGAVMGKDIRYQDERFYALNESTIELLSAVKDNILTENEEEPDCILIEWVDYDEIEMTEEMLEEINRLNNENKNNKNKKKNKDNDEDEDDYQILD